MTYEVDSDVPVPPSRADYVKLAAAKCLTDKSLSYRDAGRSISEEVWSITPKATKFDPSGEQAETLAKNLGDEISEVIRSMNPK